MVDFRKLKTVKTRTQLGTLIVALVAMIFGIATAFGQTVSPTGNSTSMAIPKIGKAVSGATNVPPQNVTMHGRQLMADPYVGVNIEVVPVLLPAQNMAISWEARARFQEDYLNKTLTNNAGYQLISNGKINWENTVYAEGTNTAWPVVQQFTKVESKDGSDSISLSMLRVSAISTGDALTSTYQVGEFGYSDIVFGIRKDGSRVTSGDPDQIVAKLIIVTQMSLFNGGATQAGLDQVEAYVMGQENFSITYHVTMAGDTEAIGIARVSILVPRLEWTSIGVRLLDGGTNNQYDLLVSDVVTGGPWSKIATLHTGETLQVNRRAKSAQFIRAVLSP